MATKQRKNELAEALSACRAAMGAIAVASALVNILYLTGALYMLEIYDGVLASRSVSTLVGLSILAVSLFAFQGVLDILRGRLMIRIGRFIGDRLSVRVYTMLGRLELLGRSAGDGMQPLRDIDQVRSFLSGPGPMALLDLPWIPFYIFLCFMLHFWIGLTALVGAMILISLTALGGRFTRKLTMETTTMEAQRNAHAAASRRNAEALQAMGMGPRLASAWGDANRNFLNIQQQLAERHGGLGSVSKVLRIALQSSVLGVGAYLVIHQQATAGIIIAGAIISARALAPVDQAIANWRGFVAFRQGWKRITELLDFLPGDEPRLALPTPGASLSVEGVTLVPPGHNAAVVHDISFRLEKGQALGIVGPSAAGKSCLVRALVGVWSPARGSVRIDGAPLDQWPSEALGPHMGYLPQNVELLSGTVAQNISRFDLEPDSETVIAAAQAASMHADILRLPNGYETEIGESGAALSAGQRQRVALARALYGDPFLVVLDEPNSNLDAEGDKALTRAILGIRERGGISIVVAHRPSALAGADLVMAMGQGRLKEFGPRDEILEKLRQSAPADTRPMRLVTEPGTVSS